MNKLLLGLTVPLALGIAAMPPLSRSAFAAPALTQSVSVVTRAGARLAIQAAEAAATRLDTTCSIAVVDPSGTLVAFESMDGVRAESPDLAIGKARASARLQRPSEEIEDNINKGRVAFVTGGVMALRGGMPLQDGKTVVGAIGIAGLSKDNDVKIAHEAAAAFSAALQSAH